MTVELLALIAMWCEQTNLSMIDLHECRVELMLCLDKSAKKYPHAMNLMCFAKTKKPDADAI
jgi:hypothetical protein